MPREEAWRRIVNDKHRALSRAREVLRTSVTVIEAEIATRKIVEIEAWQDDWDKRNREAIRRKDEKAKYDLEMENLKLQNELLKRKLDSAEAFPTPASSPKRMKDEPPSRQ